MGLPYLYAYAPRRFRGKYYLPSPVLVRYCMQQQQQQSIVRPISFRSLQGTIVSQKSGAEAAHVGWREKGHTVFCGAFQTRALYFAAPLYDVHRNKGGCGTIYPSHSSAVIDFTVTALHCAHSVATVVLRLPT